MLSPLGREQALRCGRWLLAHGRRFESLAVGRLRRQRETLQAITEVYAAAGQDLAEPVVMPELDEYQFTDLVRAYAAGHPDHPDLIALRERPGDKRLWVGVLHSTLTAWMSNELTGVAERYDEFQARAERAASQMRERLRSGPVLAVSSGGVMGAIAQGVLGIANAAVVDLNLSLVNTGVCEYRLSGDRLRLISLNTLPHLSAPEDRSLVSLV